MSFSLLLNSIVSAVLVATMVITLVATIYFYFVYKMREAEKKRNTAQPTTVEVFAFEENVRGHSGREIIRQTHPIPAKRKIRIGA